MHSPDLVNENFEKLAALFPNCVTEGAEGKAIDFDLLKQELSHAVVEGNKERYRLEWPGKREAIVTANLPTTKTLRPVREDSVDFDNTENLYIEGDNLEVLKLLQESYLGKIKMIYIDPPYNTGKDFVYKDNFKKDAQEELIESGQKDEYNQRLVANPETAGRYHSDWLSMMYPRLKLARNLLTQDGVIFISIDDNEHDNLLRIGKEVFGEFNFLASFTWVKKKKGSHLSKTHRSMTEYAVLFAKDLSNLELYGEAAYTDKWQPIVKRTNSKKDLVFPEGTIETILEDGEYEVGLSSDTSSAIEFKSKVIVENGIVKNELVTNAPYVWTQEKLNQEISLGTRVALSKKFGFNVLRHNQGDKVKRPSTLLDNKAEIGTNEDAYSEAIQMFGEEGVMSYPKPTSLIYYLIRSNTFFDKDAIVLDFFSGSATTAHATLKLNSEDEGRRKFIQVQIPESTDKESAAYKAGYKNICEIGKERIRRAAKKIKEETNADIDYGFRVYRLDESNMQDVYYKPQDYDQTNLDLFADNVKSDRTADDLLAQVMLDWGLPLSLKIEQATISGKKVFKVAENSLYACFDSGIDEAFAKDIAADKPLRIVFKDSAFKNDTAKTNVKQLLKQLTPETEMKVI